MAAENNQERTEPASQKRREEARKKGQIARSREIPSVFILLSGMGVFYFAGSRLFEAMAGVMQSVFQNLGRPSLSEASAHTLMVFVSVKILQMLWPLMLAVIAAGAAANLLQVGFMFSAEPLAPKLSKLDPIKGLGKLFSLRALIELTKSFIKIIIVGGMAYAVIRPEFARIPSLLNLEVVEILSFVAVIAFKVGIATCGALILLAALDYVFQRWQHEKDLRMSKQEVKEELKQREGDPMVKARIKKMQTALARHRMMENVPQAAVVITNPTHLAIALKYDAQSMNAPQVIAKGAGFIAARIREIAAANDIPVVENKPLAQTLYKTVELDHFIPAELYRAVAEILAYVYRLKSMRPATSIN